MLSITLRLSTEMAWAFLKIIKKLLIAQEIDKMGYEELVKKNNTIHPTAVINWEKVQMGNGNVVGPFVCRGTDAQRKNQMATYILETIIPLENLRQYICQQKFQRLLLSAMKIILCVIRILPMTVRLKVK